MNEKDLIKVKSLYNTLIKGLAESVSLGEVMSLNKLILEVENK